jgi:hypothetical protein
MGRTVAVVWHALFSVAAGVLYFFFVLPRWPELGGHTSHTLGTVLRIVTGALIALAALPVVFSWLRTRKPEYGNPQLALTLRVWSIVGHVLAGALIIGAAISEIWFSLDDAGRWLFGIYGAAAAIAILGVFGFYLSFVAALPPPPPRPLKSKPAGRRLRRRKGEDAAAAEEDAAAQETTEEAGAGSEETAISEETAAQSEDQKPGTEEDADVKADDGPAEVTAEDETAAEDKDDETPAAEDTGAGEPGRGGLRNRRPAGKTETPSRWRRRSRGGVAVDD